MATLRPTWPSGAELVIFFFFYISSFSPQMKPQTNKNVVGTSLILNLFMAIRAQQIKFGQFQVHFHLNIVFKNNTILLN